MWDWGMWNNVSVDQYRTQTLNALVPSSSPLLILVQIYVSFIKKNFMVIPQRGKRSNKKKDVERRAILQNLLWLALTPCEGNGQVFIYLFFFTHISSDVTGIWTSNCFGTRAFWLFDHLAFCHTAFLDQPQDSALMIQIVMVRLIGKRSWEIPRHVRRSKSCW